MEEKGRKGTLEGREEQKNKTKDKKQPTQVLQSQTRLLVEQGRPTNTRQMKTGGREGEEKEGEKRKETYPSIAGRGVASC